MMESKTGPAADASPQDRLAAVCNVIDEKLRRRCANLKREIYEKWECSIVQRGGTVGVSAAAVRVAPRVTVCGCSTRVLLRHDGLVLSLVCVCLTRCCRCACRQSPQPTPQGAPADKSEPSTRTVIPPPLPLFTAQVKAQESRAKPPQTYAVARLA